MTAEVTLYLFMALLQGATEPYSEGFGSKEACLERHAEITKLADVLWISECAPLNLKARIKAGAEGPGS